MFVLRDYVNVISKEDLAAHTFREMQGINENYFYSLYTQLLIKQAELKNQVTDNTESGIKSSRNPAFFDEFTSSWDNYAVSYNLLKPKDEEKYVWYVIPENTQPLSITNFESNHRASVKIEKMSDGTEVFSTMTITSPEQGAKAKTIYFPMIAGDSVKYTVVCERYKDNIIVGVEKYVQYYKDKKSFEETTRRTQLYEVQTELNKMKEAQSKIDGNIMPIHAVYVNEETGRSLVLQIFYGKSKENKNQYKIIDLTKGAETVYYEGDTLLKALIDFNVWQSYPDGVIKIRLDGTEYTIKTTGGSLLHTFGTWSGFLATLSFVGGIAASLIPGGQVVAPVLFAAAFTLGGASAIMGFIDTYKKDNVEEGQLLLDGLVVATMFAGLAGVGLRALGIARNVECFVTAARYVFYTVAISDTVQGVIMLEGTAQQIDNILLDKTLSGADRLIRLTEVITSFFASLAMIVYTATDHIALKSNLKGKGVTDSILTKLEKKPEEMMLVDILSESEIRQAIKKNRDLVGYAKEVKAQKLKAQHELELNKVWEMHGLKSQMTRNRLGISLDELTLEGASGKLYKPTARKKKVPEKEVNLAEKIMKGNTDSEEAFIFTLEDNQDGIDGFYKKSGQPVQLKSSDATAINQPRALVDLANEAYSSAVKNGWENIELHMEAPLASKSDVLARWTGKNRQPPLKVQNDGAISKIIAHCADGDIELPIVIPE